MICEIWSWPIFEILSILDIDPEFLILEPASFRSVVRCAIKYTMKTLVRRCKKNCVVIQITEDLDFFEQQYIDNFVYLGVTLGSLARIPAWL